MTIPVILIQPIRSSIKKWANTATKIGTRMYISDPWDAVVYFRPKRNRI